MRFTEAEYAAIQAKRSGKPSRKPNNGRTRKYGNERVEVDGIKFDSKKEAARYVALRMLEHHGFIRNLRLQVPYKLTERRKYIADFVYEELGGFFLLDWVEVVEDCKGYRTEVYKLKRDLMKEKYGIVIRET